MPIGAGNLSLAMILFNRLIRGQLPQMKRHSINVYSGDLYHEVLEVCQRQNDKGKATPTNSPIFIKEATVTVQPEDQGLWTHGVIIKPNNNDH